MIICRTPFRVSFFGGGTDYPAWYRQNGGAVLATSIDKYCYISCRYLPPFFEHKSRIVWSLIERVKSIEEIQHPAVRTALAFLDITDGVEIHYDGDLPARSGIGSSSAFAVGLLHALNTLKGAMPSKKQLALDAIYLEQTLLKENVGSQDQILVAFGGFNRIDFHKEGEFRVTPIILSKERSDLFQKHLMLCFTGIARTSSDIAGEHIKSIPNKKKELETMQRMVDEGMKILTGNGDLTEFGKLLHESWELKRSLATPVSTPYVDEIYKTARDAGAIGGKLLGAGGGGFFLLFARPEQQHNIRKALGTLIHVPLRFENSGSQIVFYDPV